MRKKRAVVLLSGGLDSATTLYIAKKKGYEVFCLIFDYVQRHCREVKAAQRLAQKSAAPFYVVKIRLPWKGSSLLDSSMPVTSWRKAKGIPSTYVPARNTIFLSFALSYAEAIDAGNIFIGANSIDYSGYPDCRPEYYAAFNRLSGLATKAGVEGRAIRILTPLVAMSKAEIIKAGLKLGVPYEDTWSCYKGGKRPCGVCESCVLRKKGFKEAGMDDPLLK